MNIYTEVPSSQIAAEKEYFLSAIFKLLPYKENNYEFLDGYFESILQRFIGFNKLTGCKQPEIITIMSLLECARQEDDFDKYRKAILDACGLVKLIKESDFDA